jgi:hypothetical protein
LPVAVNVAGGKEGFAPETSSTGLTGTTAIAGASKGSAGVAGAAPAAMSISSGLSAMARRVGSSVPELSSAASLLSARRARTRRA